MAVAFYLVVRNGPSKNSSALIHPQHSKGLFSGLSIVFGSKDFWKLVPLTFASYGTLITVQGLWGGPYLMHTYGLSKATASGVLMAVPLGVICGAPLWGRWSDKIGRRKMPILLGQGVMLVVFSSLAMHLHHLTPWGLLLQFWLIGFTYSSNSIIYAQVKEIFPLCIGGTALSSLNFFLMLGGAVFQHLMGIIMGNWQPSLTGDIPVSAYQYGFGISAALLALALAVYNGSREAGSGAIDRGDDRQLKLDGQPNGKGDQ